MKILYYLRALNIGGAETFVYNVLEKIDLKQYSIDIVLQSDKNENKRLITLCQNNNIRIHYVCPFEKNYFKSYRQFLDLACNNHYDIIHYHANSLINNIPILVSKKVGCKLVIHSHNSKNNSGGLIGRTLHFINRWVANRQDFVRLACSEKAGKWMFGNKPYTIINNGINIDTFGYDRVARSQLRSKFGIEDCDIVWGHVGRFVHAKNHAFLIKCFEVYNQTNPHSKLVLCGDGPLMQEIKDNVKNCNVIFLGSLQDTSKYYSMFDLMVFPSFFEGLPFTLVEAQASGLPILASDNITKLVNITGLVKYLSLERSLEEWCTRVPGILSDNERLLASDKMKFSIFDSNLTIQQIYDCYKV